MCVFVTALAADVSNISRVDIEDLPMQAMMELLVSMLGGRDTFMTPEGHFSDVSKWDGVIMTEKNEVMEINFGLRTETNLCALDDFHEVQTIPNGGSIDLRWIPSTVEVFSITGLKLSSTIETEALPRNLKNFDVSSNEFRGTFAMDNMPRTIVRLNISTNVFEGFLNLEAPLPHLRNFNATWNSFSGSLNFSSLPPRISRVQLSNNRFSGTISLTNVPESLVHLNISNNSIEQDSIFVNEHVPRMVFFAYDLDKIGKLIDTNGKEYLSCNVSIDWIP